MPPALAGGKIKFQSMKKSVFLLFFVFSALMAAAQGVNYLTTYHPAINKAEMAIIESDYLKALQQYEIAFKAVPRPFMKDYYNASLCATLTGNADACYFYLLKVADKGLSLDFVKDEFAFAAIQKDPSWRSFELKYLAAKRSAEARFNKRVWIDLDFMTRLDAKYRKGNLILNSDSVKVIDQGNALRLEKLIERVGFPDEELIGLGTGGFPIIQYPFYSVLRHQTGNYMTVNFSNSILNAVRLGKINPHIAVNILGTITGADTFFSRHVFKISTEDARSVASQPFAFKLDKWVYRELLPADEAEFDALRKGNGMETLAEYRQKIKFSLRDERFLFPYKVFAGVWVVSDPKIIDEYLDGTILLK